jgi:methyltransferase (TIGR00027 family)
MSKSTTAELMAFYRALETRKGSGLFTDPAALGFLRPSLRALVHASRFTPVRRAIEGYADYRAPGARTSGIARTRFIDDFLRARVRDGTKQLVLLGSGYDSRAERLPELHDVAVFEIDRAAMHEEKHARRPRPPNRTSVSADLLEPGLSEALAASGFDRRAKAAFVWEGVTNYLTREGVERVLAFLATAAEGSTLVMTYVHAGLLDGSIEFEGGAKLVDGVQKLGEPWRFGFEPGRLRDELARFGLRLDSDASAIELRARYWGPNARRMRGYGFYRTATATRVRSTS